MRKLRSLWIELGQRGVLKAAIVYAVIGFCLLLITDLLAYAVPLPGWLKPLLLQTLLLGVPVTTASAWVFDLRRDIRPVGGRDLDEIMSEERLRSVSVYKTAAVVAACMLVTFVMSAFMTVHRDVPDVAANARVVVAPLENRSDDAGLDELGEIAADWAAQRLIQTRQFEVVPYSAVEQYAAAAPLSPAASSYSHALEIARGTGAGLVVWGAYYFDGDSLRYTVQLTDARTGELVRNIDPVAVSRAYPRAGLNRLRENIAFAVARETRRRVPAWPINLPNPPALDAHRTFVSGLWLVAHGNYAGAADQFALAYRQDSSLVAARLWQARSLAETGSLIAANSVAVAVDSARALLSIYDRAVLDRVMALASFNPDLRYGSAATMLMAVPAADEASGALAVDALALNHPREARNILGTLNPDHGAMRGWPGYYVNYALAEHLVENYRGELRVARLGRERFPNDAKMILATCRALAALGQVEGALTALRSIRTGAERVRCAEELFAHGHAAAGLRAAQSAVYLYYTHRTDVRDRLEYPLAILMLGDAKRAYNVMLQLSRESVPRELRSAVDFRLAVLAAAAGLRDQAVAHEVTALEKMSDSPYVTLERARLAAARGDANEALHLAVESLSGGLPYAESAYGMPHADFMLRSLRRVTSWTQLLVPRG